MIRPFLLAGALALALSGPTGPARAQTPPDVEAARTPIERFNATLLECMQGGEALGLEGRRQKLEPVIADVYDVPFMSAKVVGREWKKLDDAQRQRWIDVFGRLTVATYAERMNSFDGEQLVVDGVEPGRRDTAVVFTRIIPNGEDAVEINYRMRPDGDSWRIVDVYLNGTVSELALRRSEYTSVIERDGFESLVSTLEEKLATGRASDGTNSD